MAAALNYNDVATLSELEVNPDYATTTCNLDTEVLQAFFSS